MRIEWCEFILFISMCFLKSGKYIHDKFCDISEFLNNYVKNQLVIINKNLKSE